LAKSLRHGKAIQNDEIVFIDNNILYFNWVLGILVKSIYEQKELCHPNYRVRWIIGDPDYRGSTVVYYVISSQLS
jgi:hypothetical protein